MTTPQHDENNVFEPDQEELVTEGEGQKTGGPETEDELADEWGEDSFPASDPPAF